MVNGYSKTSGAPINLDYFVKHLQVLEVHLCSSEPEEFNYWEFICIADGQFFKKACNLQGQKYTRILIKNYIEARSILLLFFTFTS